MNEKKRKHDFVNTAFFPPQIVVKYHLWAAFDIVQNELFLYMYNFT